MLITFNTVTFTDWHAVLMLIVSAMLVIAVWSALETFVLKEG